MEQLILLLVSFLYGIIVGIFSFFLRNHKILKIFYYIFMTLIYVLIFYFLNDGEIHLYNKFLLILGFCFYYILVRVKLNVKLKKYTRKN